MAINDGRDDIRATGTGTTEVHGTSTVRDAPERAAGMGWLPWLIGALLLGLLLWWLLGRDDDREVVAPVTEPTIAAAPTATVDGTQTATAYASSDLDSYLRGTDPVGRAYSLDRVNFASGSATVDAAGKAEVAELAGVLKRYPNARVSLVGFADPEGDAAANQALAQRRAEAVRAALQAAGASTNAVTVGAEGETGTAAVRSNRKVEARITAR